jgi:hypothetical protein
MRLISVFNPTMYATIASLFVSSVNAVFAGMVDAPGRIASGAT